MIADIPLTTVPARPLPLTPQPPPATSLPRMAEQSTADLLALDTEALKGRLSELRRYL
jgi:hypothetical protein